MKNNKKYYSPTEYQKYRNASKVMNSGNKTDDGFSVQDDEFFFNQLQAENNRHRQRENGKTEQPKPPANVKPKEQKRYSVYDEIAQRHKRERAGQTVGGLTPLKPITPVVPDEPVVPEKQAVPEKKKPKNPPSDKAVEEKILNHSPVTEEEAELFTARVAQMADNDEYDGEYYTQADIEEICEYYRKKYSRKMWIVLIVSLVVFCGLVGGMCLYTGGYLDNLIQNIVQ